MIYASQQENLEHAGPALSLGFSVEISGHLWFDYWVSIGYDDSGLWSASERFQFPPEPETLAAQEGRGKLWIFPKDKPDISEKTTEHLVRHEPLQRAL